MPANWQWADLYPYVGPLAGLLPWHAPDLDEVHDGGNMHVPAAIRPLLAAHIAQRTPLLVVTTTQQEADILADNLSAWIGPDNVGVFPAWETMPHERLSPQVHTVGQRLHILEQVRQRAVRVVVAPVRAVMQPMDPRLSSRPILHLGGPEAYTQGMDQLASDLASLGYQRVDMVTDRGEFAVRGGLLDVFSTVADNPIRIEFFGDDIDNVRLFDPEDQRTIQRITEHTIYPARELVLDDDTAGYATHVHPHSPQLQDKLALLGEHMACEGAEGLVNAIIPRTVTLIELMDPDTGLVIMDAEQVADRATKLIDQSVQLMVSDWAAMLLQDLASQEGSDDPAIRTLVERLVSTVSTGGFVQWDAVLQQMEGRTVWSFSSFETPTTLVTYAGRPWTSFAGNPDAMVNALRPYANQLAFMPQGTSKRDLSHVVISVCDERGARRVRSVLQQANIGVSMIGPEQLAGEDRGFARIPDGRLRMIISPLQQGFISDELQLVMVGEMDVFGVRRTVSRKRSVHQETAEQLVLNMEIGDPIVHEVHGVGRYMGLVTRELPGMTTVTGGKLGRVIKDYVDIEYANNNHLYVPSDQVDSLTIYRGGDNPRIMRLGGGDWKRTKQKVKDEVSQMTAELIRLYQIRNHVGGHAFSPDLEMLAKLEESFAFVETTDQLASIAQVKEDMAKPKPMDRLLCGDVGFGKTEVAVRAAGMAVFDGKQVAVLVPTTLLAQQHGETFTNRFAGLPVTVRVLSRFATPKEVTEILAGLKSGAIEIVVGTHRLLGNDVTFAELGLVIVDEEQRFGVGHKERLKQLKTSVDVLSMSATPIPRTMEMAVMGIRDMSTISTPPMDRQAVITQVTPWDESLAILAVRRELLRDGQVFWLHNKVATIDARAYWLQSQIPEARIAVAHGQMNEQELEAIMVDFWNHKTDVLVATTIIENGIDIVNANTLVVEHADQLGMSQLYQLRGRVGRSAIRGHAHFFYPDKASITERAWKRLEGLATHTNLGAGMAIAMEDLAIRGAGALLGTEQSGSVVGVGLDAYTAIVNEAVAELTDTCLPEAEQEVRIDIPLDACIPTEWIASETLRLQAYRRIANIRTGQDMANVKASLEDRFGTIPEQAQRLLGLAAVKTMLRMWGIHHVTTTPRQTLMVSPVELKESQQVRLRRLVPYGVYSSSQGTLELPMPKRGENKDMVQFIAAKLMDILGSPA